MGLSKTKVQLLDAATRESQSLASMFHGMSREQMLWPGSYGWSAKDHLAHLSEWERMLFAWYDAGWRGENPAVPGEGYTWDTLSQLNQAIFEKYQNAQLEHVMADWWDTSRRLIAMANSISEADLFTPGRYAWTGRGTLAAFVDECGPNHYRWAAAEIKKGLKFRR